MRGHIYCTEKCARDAGRHAVWRRVRSVLATPVPARAAVAAVAIAAATPVMLALRTARELDRVSLPASPVRATRGTAPARLESVTETAAGLRLEGSAPAGGAVFLFSGSRFVGAAPVENGRFQFDGVREKGPFRVGALPLSAPIAWTPPAPAPPEPSSAARLAPSPRAASSSVPPPVLAAEARPAPNAPAARKSVETVEIRPRRPTPPAAEPAVSPPPAGRAPVAPPAGNFPADLTRGPSDRPDILVSFDAGSSDRGATAILDALSARGIRTTIFLTGEFIRRYPEIARRIAADGHEVGNHTDTHPHLTTYASDGRQATRAGVDRAFLAGQLLRPARLYRDATGRSMAPVWRAPFGEHNPEIRRWAAELGYWHVGWTGGRSGLDGLDWITDPRSRAFQPAERLLARLVAHAENGGIVLLHLGSDREEPVASRIGLLFDGLTARGFRFCRASDFLAREGYDEARLASFRAPAPPVATR